MQYPTRNTPRKILRSIYIEEQTLKEAKKNMTKEETLNKYIQQSIEHYNKHRNGYFAQKGGIKSE